jgi:hypothetical protein
MQARRHALGQVFDATDDASLGAARESARALMPHLPEDVRWAVVAAKTDLLRPQACIARSA